jgi:hypothetical protein
MTPEQLNELRRSAGWTFGVSPLIPAVTPATKVTPSAVPAKVPKEVPSTRSVPSVNPTPSTRTATPLVTVINPGQKGMQQNQNANKNQSKVQNVNQVQTKSLVSNITQSASQTKSQVENQAQTKSETIMQVQPLTPIKTVTPNPDQIKPQPPAPGTPINLSGHQKPSRIPNNAFGTVTWKQGAVWWARWYPYRQEDSVSLHQKPLDAVQVQNGNSAYDTIQTLTGMPPDKVPLFRMGFEDVTVKAPPHDPVIQNRESISFMRNVSARGRTTGLHHRPNDLGAGVVESKTKMGVRRHLKLV